MFWLKLVTGLSVALALVPGRAFAESAPPKPSVAQARANAPAPAPAPAAPVKPYRTFITLQNYVMENNGDAKNPISNVRIVVKFPNKDKEKKNQPEQEMELPEVGQYWPIGNGQQQEISRTFELPFEAVQQDSFTFQIQMVRKGAKFLPCNFQVTELSQYNRQYFCHTDVDWQIRQRIPEERLDKEGIQVRVFTDLNTPSKEIPKDALALR